MLTYITLANPVFLNQTVFQKESSRLVRRRDRRKHHQAVTRFKEQRLLNQARPTFMYVIHKFQFPPHISHISY